MVQADGFFQLEQGINSGDAWDFWKEGMTLEADVRVQPNTASYQRGIVRESGIIKDISANGNTMSFGIDWAVDNRLEQAILIHESVVAKIDPEYLMIGN